MIIREFVQDDIPDIVKQASNFNVSRYLASIFPYPYTREDAVWWANTGSKTGLQKAIDLNGECIGGIGALFGEGEHEHTARIGYWLGEPHWGKGIATEALSRFTDEVFSGGKIVRLSAAVFSPNKASMRVLEKCGFVLEGIMVKGVFKNQTFMDEHIYAKLRP